MSSLYDRIGGFSRVRLIVSDFYQRVLESELLRPMFSGADMRRLIDHQTQFISALLGGPAAHTAEQIGRAHARLNITEAMFAETRLLLIETLEDRGLEPADVARVTAQLDALRPRLVTHAGERPS
jgi:hemoglobin